MNIDLDIINSEATFWKILVQAGEMGASLPMLAGKTSGAVFNAAHMFCEGLVASGVLDKVEQSAAKNRAYAYRYRIKTDADGKIIVPVLDQSIGHAEKLRRHVWTVLRNSKNATLTEIIYYASTDDFLASKADVETYIRQLVSADIVLELSPDGPNAGIKSSRRKEQIYRLKAGANTGPNPPKLLRATMVYDANSDKIVGRVKSVEVAA